ncbi:ClpXP protease specificity-enhancing factor [Vreelandella rituensis]|uniref:ClpXP protease specificity-enhancing factor n=1 Tax=Vreelandella rituensis TaxID=2282306 RepID=A0A368TUP7_9GAMM|nr:ClpXP protease specificity-enhancing factor [Halomonas rituensis]RCV88499.1 ClpXP protease specificity-enhancing factor [Halomonas rituensis]
MHSSRPYLARALYQWLLDNELTPYLVVDADLPGVEVPRQFVQNGQIVLNVAPTAVRDFFMENQAVGFNARFGGQPMQVMIPTEALIAIYARENGVGMVFGHEPVLVPAGETSESESASRESRRPELSITQTTEGKGDQASPEPTEPKDSGSSDNKPGSDTKPGSDGKTSRKRPTLRVIK